MVYSPFDFNEAIANRKEFVEDGLRAGSPVVGMSYAGGLFLLTVRQKQRKIFEIYDRIIYSAIGRQSDIEDIRLGAVRVAHEEGYTRSPDDVTAHRLVGFALSPPLKRLFGDQFNAPAVVRAVFGELGMRPEDDRFYVLNYDGDFTQSEGLAVIAGSMEAEEGMARLLADTPTGDDLEASLRLGLRAWAVGSLQSTRTGNSEDHDDNPEGLFTDEVLSEHLRERLSKGSLEVGLLDRRTPRESKFRLLSAEELASVTSEWIA
jgi:proteasome alpha subunit